MNGVLILCDDMIFSSKVTATGRAQGITVVVTRTAAAALKKAAETFPACVIVDLHNPSLSISDFVAEVKQLGSPRVIGFGSHVNVELLKSAREAGCDLVLPRSQFDKLLESELPNWAAKADSPRD